MIKLFNDKLEYTNSENVINTFKPTDILRFLSSNVELDESFTFGSLMNMLYQEKNLVNYIFGNTLGFFDFDLFYQDFLKDMSAEEAEDHKTEYLEVYYVPDLWKYENNDPFDFHPYFGFHLIKEKDEHGEKTPYGIAFTSLSTLKYHKLKVNKKVDYYFHDTTVEMPQKYVPTHVAKLEGIRLFDLIDAILHEISWHGSPVMRDETVKELSDIQYEFEENKDNVKSYTVDEVKEMFKANRDEKK